MHPTYHLTTHCVSSVHMWGAPRARDTISYLLYVTRDLPGLIRGGGGHMDTYQDTSSALIKLSRVTWRPAPPPAAVTPAPGTMTHPHQHQASPTPTHPLLGLGQVPAYPVQEAGAGARSLVNMVLDRKDNTWLQVDITISGNIYTI